MQIEELRDQIKRRKGLEQKRSSSDPSPPGMAISETRPRSASAPLTLKELEENLQKLQQKAKGQEVEVYLERYKRAKSEVQQAAERYKRAKLAVQEAYFGDDVDLLAV